VEKCQLSPWMRERGFIRRIVSGNTCYIRPPLRTIPAGPFIMGSDRAHDPYSSKYERPRRTVHIGHRVRLGRFPVTVAEYGRAVDIGAVPVPPTYEGKSWDTQREQVEHPVVNVSWYAAKAYAEWLATMTGEPWRLPTEEEWEKAARGKDGRIYPWGDEWEENAANVRARPPRQTSPIGAYPGDVSPYGIYDMAGNVSEWTGTMYPLEWDDSYTGEHIKRVRYALKGGSWLLTPRRARAADHSVDHADSVGSSSGMRLALGLTAAGQGSPIGSPISDFSS
jgi:formylglycine-generating enzyme required for sulfatase activity